MKIIRSVAEAYQFRQSKSIVGLVPTMGAIHAGHLSLIRQAKHDCDIVIVTIFANPMQFSNSEDFASYPNSIDQDLDLLKKEEVDIVFCPSVSEIYPDGFTTSVVVEKFSDLFEGKSRPGHFKGVTTIVTKLLNMFLASKVYFGQKDFQQTFLIKKINVDLNINSEIIILPTIREFDGLPASSRNILLSNNERISAGVLYTALERIKYLTTFDSNSIYKEVKNCIAKEKLVELDYVKIVDPNTFCELLEVNGDTIILIAIKVGDVRLIDNLFIKKVNNRIEIDYRFERYC
ncbi:MAG: pantoate--beta-alanine ligase [SAR202 cluster bacterium]|nr:pantoate--beta-alanine ligase [SAR202 cluster bacterium]|tara:strand:- start:52336 stop:53205 length:870 start_codon:yes stop_codon:yes gene_type:complete